MRYMKDLSQVSKLGSMVHTYMDLEMADRANKKKTKLVQTIRAFIYYSFDSNIAIKCLKQRVMVTK